MFVAMMVATVILDGVGLTAKLYEDSFCGYTIRTIKSLEI